MNACNLIAGGIHSVSGQFSDYWDFAEWISLRYKDLAYDRNLVHSRLYEDIRQMTMPRARIDQQYTLEYLIARDLARADSVLSELPSSVTELKNWIYTSRDSIIDIFRSWGFEISKPDIFIVERFPEPCHEMDWVALVSSEIDREKYGIIPGVYLLESEVAPYYSELILAHELVHTITKEKNPYLHGRGLEEGIADIIGILYIGSHLYSSRIAHNVFVHSRLGNRLSQSNILYLDYARQASILYRRFGLKGLFQLLREGREVIKSVEESCLSGNIDSITLQAGDWDEKTDLSYR